MCFLVIYVIPVLASFSMLHNSFWSTFWIPIPFFPIIFWQIYFISHILFTAMGWYLGFWIYSVFNRPGVARAVPYTPLSLINSVIHSCIQSLSHPFVQNLQDTVFPKPQELGSRHFERMFTPLHVSHVMCHLNDKNLN